MTVVVVAAAELAAVAAGEEFETEELATGIDAVTDEEEEEVDAAVDEVDEVIVVDALDAEAVVGVMDVVIDEEIDVKMDGVLDGAEDEVVGEMNAQVLPNLEVALAEDSLLAEVEEEDQHLVFALRQSVYLLVDHFENMYCPH